MPCRVESNIQRHPHSISHMPHSPGDGARLDDGAAIERDGAVRRRAGEPAVAVV